MRQEILRKLRRISIALSISGGLNIVLIVFIVYAYIKERPPTTFCESKPIKSVSLARRDTSNSKAIKVMRLMPPENLVALLKDKRLVENGYSYRDLALASLITWHHFNFAKAIATLPPPKEKRVITVNDERSDPIDLTVFADVKEAHFDAAIHFFQTEKWPYTSEGLYQRLKETANRFDRSLDYAFYITPEFLNIELLFTRAENRPSRKDLLTLLLDGSWDLLQSFCLEQKREQDLSDEKRRALLLGFLQQNSKTAAQLLLLNDFDFAAKKLDDNTVGKILSLATSRTIPAAKYALTMLTSPRGDSVWREAAKRLYEFAGEEAPLAMSREDVLARFIPSTNKEKKTPMRRSKHAYIVQEGDSLWKISRRFHIDIETLKQENGLMEDTLQPESLLFIPTYPTSD